MWAATSPLLSLPSLPGARQDPLRGALPPSGEPTARPATEDVPGGLVLRGAGDAGDVAEGGQDPLPRPRQRRQDHAPPHAQGRGRGKNKVPFLSDYFSSYVGLVFVFFWGELV